MGRRTLLAVVAGLLLLPSAVQAADAPALAGETVIAGDRSGYVVVNIPTGLYFDPTAMDERFTVEGAGDIVGIYLRPDRALAAGEDTLIATRSRARNGLHVYMARGSGSGGVQDRDSLTLPAGRYRLYLIAGTGTARVTMRLPELTGRAELAPKVAVAARTAPLPLIDEVSGATTRFGAPGTLAGDGILHVSGAYEFAPVSGPWYAEGCFYEGGEPADRSQAYRPTCPGANGFFSSMLIRDFDPGPTRYGMEMTAYPFKAGPTGLGGSITGAGVKNVTAFGLWLPAEGMAIAAAPAVRAEAPKTIVQVPAPAAAPAQRAPAAKTTAAKQAKKAKAKRRKARCGKGRKVVRRGGKRRCVRVRRARR